MYANIEIQNVLEPFPHLKCEDGPECGIGMDCPVYRPGLKRVIWFY